MKLPHITLFFLIPLFFSCTQEKTDRRLPVKVYSEEDFAEKIRIVDTACQNATRKAEKDIRNGKLVLNITYIYRPFRHDTIIREKHIPGFDVESEVIPLVTEFGISIDSNVLPIHDIVMTYDYYFRKHCYETRMRDAVIEKFGDTFIDSLKKTAEKKYVEKHPDLVYEADTFDSPGKSGASNYHACYNKLNAEFRKYFVYPPEYKTKNEKIYSYTTASFLLMKDGSIKELEVKASFANIYNEKFRNNFESQLKAYILKTDWISPTCHGIPVNASVDFVFHHK